MFRVHRQKGSVHQEGSTLDRAAGRQQFRLSYTLSGSTQGGGSQEDDGFWQDTAEETGCADASEAFELSGQSSTRVQVERIW